MFQKLKEQVQKNFANLSSSVLFYVTIDRDEIFQRYLSGFNEENQQEHNCNACKSFLRQWGGIAAIRDNKVISIWDDIDLPEYAGAAKALSQYIHSLPVTDVFYSSTRECGTDKNLSQKSGIVWNHFYLVMPNKFVANEVPTMQSSARANKEVLKRGLEELSIDATETVLDLIAQGSLYRGEEFKTNLTSFLKIQKEYKDLPEEDRDNFCWSKSTETSVSKIRNHAIGTLLIDLSENMDLDQAVTKFERVVAPTNYQRPKALVSPKMVEAAKQKLNELGLLESLERRFAEETDISTENILFTDNSSKLKDIFDDIAKDTLVNPKSLTKVEDIHIEDFIKNVIPRVNSIEILVENSHLGNMVSLLTAVTPEAPTLFQWDNHFSISYTGGVADSIKEKVKAAGGKVEGELRASLEWHNYDDLDIHVIEPNKNRIYFSCKKSSSSGELDVDENAGHGRTRTPVENIIWANKGKMMEGEYEVLVHNFCKRETNNVGFTVQIECQGEVFDFDFKDNPRDKEYQPITKFRYSKTEGITLHTQAKTSISSKEKWGVKTNQFRKVTKMMLSPNYWNGNKGNKHYLFFLEGCKADESPRPFFNEFLKQDFHDHRKVFEVLASKLKVEDNPNQLSGVGFSETKRNSLIARVEGTFKRTLRINF